MSALIADLDEAPSPHSAPHAPHAETTISHFPFPSTTVLDECVGDDHLGDDFVGDGFTGDDFTPLAMMSRCAPIHSLTLFTHQLSIQKAAGGRARGTSESQANADE
jgi:hypothetical protein